MNCLTQRPTDVADQARALLLRNPYLALKNVTCEYSAGVLTLRGYLPSYYLKQIAQTIVANLEGVGRLVNAIEVVATAARRTERPQD
ncbi:MAG TPA: BON domain-containing protein [Gemmataceae bacterium]|jgi:osmotically-inducible protein OsmY|nr:BON domain-containing protein [Gemmataceae bacterium]